MKKGVIIGIIIAVIIIGTITAYSVIDQNSDDVIPSTAIPKTTGVNHSIELSEGLTMTSPAP